MRVISGKYKSRRLQSLKGNFIRPTADRVKESLFNIIFDKIINANVLDLFCGSGALGIESLSRGAKSAVFVDSFNGAIKLCKDNLQMMEKDFEVVLSDFRGYLRRCTQRFDIIFLDPPYNQGLGAEALNLIVKENILQAGGIAVLEDELGGAEIEGLKKFDNRKYGSCQLTFYLKEKELQ